MNLVISQMKKVYQAIKKLCQAIAYYVVLVRARLKESEILYKIYNKCARIVYTIGVTIPAVYYTVWFLHYMFRFGNPVPTFYGFSLRNRFFQNYYRYMEMYSTKDLDSSLLIKHWPQAALKAIPEQILDSGPMFIEYFVATTYFYGMFYWSNIAIVLTTFHMVVAYIWPLLTFKNFVYVFAGTLKFIAYATDFNAIYWKTGPWVEKFFYTEHYINWKRDIWEWTFLDVDAMIGASWPWYTWHFTGFLSSILNIIFHPRMLINTWIIVFWGWDDLYNSVVYYLGCGWIGNSTIRTLVATPVALLAIPFIAIAAVYGILFFSIISATVYLIDPTTAIYPHTIFILGWVSYFVHQINYVLSLDWVYPFFVTFLPRKGFDLPNFFAEISVPFFPASPIIFLITTSIMVVGYVIYNCFFWVYLIIKCRRVLPAIIKSAYVDRINDKMIIAQGFEDLRPAERRYSLLLQRRVEDKPWLMEATISSNWITAEVLDTWTSVENGVYESLEEADTNKDGLQKVHDHFLSLELTEESLCWVIVAVLLVPIIKFAVHLYSYYLLTFEQIRKIAFDSAYRVLLYSTGTDVITPRSYSDMYYQIINQYIPDRAIPMFTYNFSTALTNLYISQANYLYEHYVSGFWALGFFALIFIAFFFEPSKFSVANYNIFGGALVYWFYVTLFVIFICDTLDTDRVGLLLVGDYIEWWFEKHEGDLPAWADEGEAEDIELYRFVNHVYKKRRYRRKMHRWVYYIKKYRYRIRIGKKIRVRIVKLRPSRMARWHHAPLHFLAGRRKYLGGYEDYLANASNDLYNKLYYKYFSESLLWDGTGNFLKGKRRRSFKKAIRDIFTYQPKKLTWLQRFVKRSMKKAKISDHHKLTNRIIDLTSYKKNFGDIKKKW